MEEEEVKADETREEEAEAKTEMEGTVQQMLKEKGMKNPMSNVITVKNMGIMPMNVGRNSMI